ncbi:MAG: hypothetical protein PW788_15685 [Micavibrio sp.]|nr:hypothetical protein [Micavibrio sp.]
MLRKFFNTLSERFGDKRPQDNKQLFTTPIPEGRVNHTHTEYYFDEVESVDRWTTSGHMIWMNMEQNGYGSYDVQQRFKGYKANTLKSYASLEEATDMLIQRELYVLKNYGGVRELTYGNVKQYIENKDFTRGHILRYVKENPQILDGWFNRHATRPVPQAKNAPKP